VILIFASGKLVCTGAKKETEVHRAVSKLQETLEEKTLITYESTAKGSSAGQPITINLSAE